MGEEKTSTPVERLFEVARAIAGVGHHDRKSCELRIRADYGSWYEPDQKPMYAASIRAGDAEAWANSYANGSTPERATESLCAVAEDRLQYQIEEHTKQAAALADVARVKRYGR